MRIVSNFKKGILAAAVVGGSMMFALAASASTYNIEGFDGLPGGTTANWQSNNFIYSPAKKTNGQCDFGICLNEINGGANAGTVTTVTEVSGGGTAATDGLFTFGGFYVNVNGLAGNTPVNFMSLIFTYQDASTFTLDLPANTLLSTVPSSGLYNVVDKSGNVPTELTFDSTGYFIGLKQATVTTTTGDRSLINDLKSVEFSSLPRGGTIRLDCVAANHDSNSGAISMSELSSCTPDVSTVPVPPTLPLMAGAFGLLGLGFVSRKKQRRA